MISSAHEGVHLFERTCRKCFTTPINRLIARSDQYDNIYKDKKPDQNKELKKSI